MTSSHTYIGANITKVEAVELEKARTAECNDTHVAALLKLSNIPTNYLNVTAHADNDWAVVSL